MTNKLNERLFVSTKLTAKMQGVPALSVSINANEFCKAMQENANTVCSHCYGRKLWATAEAQYLANYIALSSSVIDLDELPRFNTYIARFNAFGELINTTHVINLFNICNVNKRTTFALWTKRPELIKQVLNDGYEKPNNLIIVLSGFYTNKAAENKYTFIDKVFNVYTKEFAQENNININCGAKSCLTCQACYTKDNGIKTINELLK